jgi:anti-sigma B factor antagonist
LPDREPDPDFPPRPFRCELAECGRTVHVRPEGELDLTTAGVVEDRLRAARTAGAGRLVVDLRGLTFMDSTGLTLLTRWSLGTERDDYEFALVAGDPRIQRLFEITGMTPHFAFVDPL